mmetsp:Transcript_37242/g.90442  ORF Transcript_37242/g.90442 Transcript_37242/m.90442 type:complete len:91 (+) Transcript_37242:226-498(+)
MSCCQRFCSEFKNPMFSLDEAPSKQPRRLDMNASFHIGRGILSWVGVLKLLTFCTSIAVLVYAYYMHPVPSFYPAFLTHWGVDFLHLLFD